MEAAARAWVWNQDECDSHGNRLVYGAAYMLEDALHPNSTRNMLRATHHTGPHRVSSGPTGSAFGSSGANMVGSFRERTA